MEPKQISATKDEICSRSEIVKKLEVLSTPLPIENKIIHQEQYQKTNRFLPPGKQDIAYLLTFPNKRKLNTSESSNPLFIGRDDGYPDDLKALLQPFLCKLCNAQLNSVKTANAHYVSKAHDKNINIWLTRTYKDKGQEAPAIKRFFEGRTGLVGPNAYHCEHCDLILTSKLHAQQHYSGRKHRLVLSKISKPSGSGYYNTDGKWVRSAKIPTTNDQRFGIGESFTRAQMQDPANKVLSSETEAESLAHDSKEPQIEQDSDSLICKLCSISVTSPLQLKLHMEGSKHRKKLNALRGDTSATVKPTNLPSSGLNDAAQIFSDVSMYRTPSGSYYCKICNMSMLHQSALVQHLCGKRHIRKAAANTTPLGVQ